MTIPQISEQELKDLKKGYLGNPNLRRINTRIRYTKDQIQELVRCSQDPNYFSANYIKITSLDRGEVLFEPYDFQKEIVANLATHRFNIINCSRQAGKTTVLCAAILHYVLFNKKKTVALLANKGDTAREILSRIQDTYEALPKWMQHGIKDFNKGSITLENGSRILARATSKTSIRGYSVDLLVMDEAAHIENFDTFWKATFPVISSGATTRVCLISTPNGLNHFYKIWSDSENGNNDFARVFADWNAVPNRDQAWADEARRQIGSDEAFSQEFECKFTGGVNTLIPPATLQKQVFIKAIKKSDDLMINYYKMPVMGHRYILTGDVAQGIGQDYTAFSIWDVTQVPYEQVCTFNNNKVFANEAAMVFYTAAKQYNNAYILIELNDHGHETAKQLELDYEYENMLSAAPKGKKGVVLGMVKNGDAYGLKTTKTTKKLGCSNLRQYLGSDFIKLNDYDTIFQLANFKRKRDSYAADVGFHDDMVMTCVIFTWMIDQEFFKEDFAGQTIDVAAQEAALEANMIPMIGGTFSQDDSSVWGSQNNFGLPPNTTRMDPTRFTGTDLLFYGSDD